MDELIMQNVNCINAFRYVDDYYLFFDSREEAQKALLRVREILREFELQMNEEKQEYTRCQKLWNQNGYL